MSYLSAEKAETELAQSIKKACSIEETAPKQKHVRSKLSFFLLFSPGFCVCVRERERVVVSNQSVLQSVSFIPGIIERQLSFGTF